MLSSALFDSAQGLHGSRILVVEDNAINQHIVRNYLELSGLIVEIANDGQEALTQLENSHFDAVLMDIHMPKMDGIEATQRIRAQECYARLPIIALTAGVTSEEREQCLVSGMNDFIAKPIVPQTLLIALVRWLKSTQPVASTMTETTVPISQISAIARPVEMGVPFALPELDLTTAVQRIGGDWSLLRQILLSFGHDFANARKKFADILVSEIPQDVIRFIHTIKGLSGTIGSAELHRLAVQFEQELCVGRETPTRVSFENKLQTIVDIIGSLSEIQSETKKEEPSRELPIILIVDDVPTNIKILADSLRRNYRIKVASNGVDALERAQLPPYPDLILLDVMMPNMDGYEVMHRLKQNPLTQKIPVIFVTAKSLEIDEEFGLHLGAVDYITKPFSIPIMKARVRNHIAMKQQADLLETLTLIDYLTKIPNRRYFNQQIESEWKIAMRNCQPLSVLMIDIDYFKNYNDHYGHGLGDECLRLVAGALLAGVARPSDMVARYGGEEFVAILPATTIASAGQIAEKLRTCVLDLNQPHPCSTAATRVSISIGCATATANSGVVSLEQLLKRADENLYLAKTLGRNRVSTGENL